MPVQRTRKGVRGPYTFAKLKDDLLAAHEAIPPKSLRELSDDYGVTHGAIQRVLAGKEPHSAHIRAALGLPALAPAPVCPVHGVVHQSKRCPKPTFEENCAAYDAWRTASAEAVAAIVQWGEERTDGYKHR